MPAATRNRRRRRKANLVPMTASRTICASAWKASKRCSNSSSSNAAKQAAEQARNNVLRRRRRVQGAEKVQGEEEESSRCKCPTMASARCRNLAICLNEAKQHRNLRETQKRKAIDNATKRTMIAARPTHRLITTARANRHDPSISTVCDSRALRIRAVVTDVATTSIAEAEEKRKNRRTRTFKPRFSAR